MKKFIINATASAFALLSLGSCSDWLTVEMEDQIMEPVLFSNYQGYVSSLNGIYLSFNEYYNTGRLTDIMDVMAQMYDVTENTSHAYKEYIAFNYKESGVESTNSSLWNKAYTIIANDNVLLDHLQDIAETPLNQQQFNLLRGEALAIRAMLHFDLVRRHGSIYSQAPDAECIPYQDDSSREIRPFLSHKDVMARILADLNEASTLLKDSDPIITQGVLNSVTEDNGISKYDQSFRMLRLNYYAVQGLLARAYLWMGDKAQAYHYAKEEVIDKVTTEDLEVFPWVTKDEVEADKRPDLIFSNEVMFSLYNNNRSNYYTNNFANTRALSSRLTYTGTNLADSKVPLIFDNENDYRRVQWKVVEPTQAEIDKAAEEGREPQSSLYTIKYQDWESGASTSGANTYRYMVPLMRLSEMYYIAAEATSNKDEAYELINTVRLHRQCPDLDKGGDLRNDLMYEYNREFIGEGQLFFFYKRRGETLIISREGRLDCNVSLTSYVWPIPESEISKRTQVKN